MLNIYKDVDAFITPSEFLKNKLVENGFDREKINCIPTFTASKSEVGEPKIGEYGLYFGRITEEKGVETVVQAFETLPDHPVKIMGDPTTEEAKRLICYVEKKNLRNIEFVGFKVNDNGVVEYFAKLRDDNNAYYAKLKEQRAEAKEAEKKAEEKRNDKLAEEKLTGKDRLHKNDDLWFNADSKEGLMAAIREALGIEAPAKEETPDVAVGEKVEATAEVAE